MQGPDSNLPNGNPCTVERRDRAAILKHFGAEVRRRREHQGLSQEALGYRCGLDRTYIGGIERGERNLGLVNLVRVADALGVEPSELLSRLGEKR